MFVQSHHLTSLPSFV